MCGGGVSIFVSEDFDVFIPELFHNSESEVTFPAVPAAFRGVGRVLLCLAPVRVRRFFSGAAAFPPGLKKKMKRISLHLFSGEKVYVFPRHI